MDVASFLTSAIVALVTLALVMWLQKRYHARANLPPGPFPLPIIGNLLAFRGKSVDELMEALKKRYGQVFTLWIGSHPMVFIWGWEIVKEALVTKKNDFAGRMQSRSIDFLVGGNVDIALSDPIPKWEVLRKIGFSAVRKYTPLVKHGETVCDIIDDAVSDMLAEEGPFDIMNYVQLIVFNIIASTAFGNRYKKDDPDFVRMNTILNSFPELVNKCVPGELLPFLRLLEGDSFQKLKEIFQEFKRLSGKSLMDHQDLYNGEINDFTDAVIASREEANPSEAGLKDLTDRDLHMTINTLFNAGNNTTRDSLYWVVLMMAIHKDIQQKIAQEILSVIGNAIPRQEDRKRCPYTCAFMQEILRYRCPLPFSLPHKSLCNSSLGGFSVPKGTFITISLNAAHQDISHWGDPQCFRPERFLENPELIKSHYLPFGIGRRGCIGERLAHVNLFLATARLVQRCTLELHGEVDACPIENFTLCIPKPFKVTVNAR